MAETTEDKYLQVPDKIVKVPMELSCELNSVEWENRARELAEAHQLTEATEERKKSVMAELNADLKIAKAKESKLTNIVVSRREQREVTVQRTFDYVKGVVTDVRTDTGEIVSQRDLTTDERQQGLFDFEADQDETDESGTPESGEVEE